MSAYSKWFRGTSELRSATCEVPPVKVMDKTKLEYLINLVIN